MSVIIYMKRKVNRRAYMLSSFSIIGRYIYNDTIRVIDKPYEYEIYN